MKILSSIFSFSKPSQAGVTQIRVQYDQASAKINQKQTLLDSDVHCFISLGVHTQYRPHLTYTSILPPSTQSLYLPIDLYSTLYLLPCTDFTNGPGLRDGFLEFVNIEEQVKSCVKESISTCDSSPICSQVWLSKKLCYELLHDTCLSHKPTSTKTFWCQVNFILACKLNLDNTLWN